MTPYELGVAIGGQQSGALEKDAGLLDMIMKLFRRAPAGAGAGARGGSRIARGRRPYVAAERAPKNIRTPGAKPPLIDIRGIPTRRELHRSMLLGTLGGGAVTAGATGINKLRGY